MSPFLSNVLLDDLDKELEHRGHSFCRYADDCNIYVRSQKAGERVMDSVTGYLEKVLLQKGRGRNVSRFIRENLNPFLRGWSNYVRPGMSGASI